MKLTLLQAQEVWTILVTVCGANKDEQGEFVRLAQETDYLEYRFRGDLGFGGKIYVENPPRVACYREDETPERNRKIKNANELFSASSHSDGKPT